LVNSSSGNEIYGELYEVDDICIQNLDRIEGVDKGLFERRKINISYVSFTSLPTDTNIWSHYSDSDSPKWVAEAYFFKRSVEGAADCGSLWTQK